MQNKKLIPSLLEEDKNSLPRRGGKYVSMKEQEEEKARLRQLQEDARRRMEECNCDCDHQPCNDF